ncbi:MAG TPA: hypothetical protein VNN79_08805 [Actinomycetota bacterium]|nr:hypothetical protein [Actinomycetota bacterium]
MKRIVVGALLLYAAIALAVVLSVSAADPSQRCESCGIVQVTPRPTPTVVGVSVPAPRPTNHPRAIVLCETSPFHPVKVNCPDTGPTATLPPTDTAP